MELSHKNGNDRVMGRSWAAAADATGSDCSVNNLTVINNEAFHSGVCKCCINFGRAQKSVEDDPKKNNFFSSNRPSPLIIYY